MVWPSYFRLDQHFAWNSHAVFEELSSSTCFALNHVLGHKSCTALQPAELSGDP